MALAKRMERVLKWVFLALVLAHLVVVGGSLTLAYRSVFKTRIIAQEARAFIIADGSSLNDVLLNMEQHLLAPAPIFVRLTLAIRGKKVVVKKGTYALPDTASTWELLDLFEQGRVQLMRITIPEGLDKWQIAELLGSYDWGDEETFRRLVDDPTPILSLDPRAEDLEGYLYPETYFFPEGATPKEVVTTMVKEFIQRSEPMRSQLEERGLNLREWVTLSSLVEEESAVSSERATIAGVFENRLNKGMKLQCDPTIIYSLKLHKRYKGKIYRSQIKYDHPYNTYVYRGLPPGPIASPGLASLQAALDPLQTPFLYFVAKNDGSHQFSKSLREHNRAVKKYQR